MDGTRNSDVVESVNVHVKPECLSFELIQARGSTNAHTPLSRLNTHQRHTHTDHTNRALLPWAAVWLTAFVQYRQAMKTQPQLSKRHPHNYRSNSDPSKIDHTLFTHKQHALPDLSVVPSIHWLQARNKQLSAHTQSQGGCAVATLAHQQHPS